MTNRMRFAGLVIAAALSAVAALLPTAAALPAPPAAPMIKKAPPTDEEFAEAIRAENPNGLPFTVTGVVSPQDDWYVVTIQPTTVDQEYTTIVQREAGALRVVAGPGGYFPNISVPGPVREYLTSRGAM